VVLKILVPFDFSEPSEKALRHAVRLSGLLYAENEIILLHVIEELSTRMALEEAFGTSRWKEEEEKRRKEGGTELGRYEKEILLHMESEACAIADEVGGKRSMPLVIRYLCKVGGRPADRIVEIAKEEKCDFIVLGNVGHTGLSKMLKMGSVSREVLERAPCPTTVVH
jgi:nucleotide-binding universal stress UspA family protein